MKLFISRAFQLMVCRTFELQRANLQALGSQSGFSSPIVLQPGSLGSPFLLHLSFPAPAPWEAWCRTSCNARSGCGWEAEGRRPCGTVLWGVPMVPTGVAPTVCGLLDIEQP